MIVCVFVLEGMYQNLEIGGGLVSPNDHIINGVICDLHFEALVILVQEDTFDNGGYQVDIKRIDQWRI